MTECRPIESPVDQSQKLIVDQGEPFSYPERYRIQVGKLIYLAITTPNLSTVIGVVSQFMLDPHTDHWNAIICILRYIKISPRQGLLYKDKGNS